MLDPATSRKRFADAEKALGTNVNQTLELASDPRLILKYDQSNQSEHVSVGIVAIVTTESAAAAGWLGSQKPVSLPSVYLSSGVAALTQDVRLFGELEAAKRQEEILPSLQILEPRLQKLSLIPLAGELVIHGDIGLARLVPVPFMGEGTRRTSCPFCWRSPAPAAAWC